MDAADRTHQLPLHIRLRRHTRLGHLGVGQNARKDVVEVVGDATGQQAKTFHPLHLHQLTLQILVGRCGCTLRGYVLNNHHRAPAVAERINQGGDAIGNLPQFSVTRDQHAAIREGINLALCQYRRHEIAKGCAAIRGVDDANVGDRATNGITLRPAGEILGGGVEERDLASRVGDDHALGDAAQRGSEQALAGLQMPVNRTLREGQLHADRHHALVEGLEQVAVGRRGLSPRHGVRVGVGGEEDHRDRPPCEDYRGDSNAVRAVRQPDVHQHQIRHRRVDAREGLVRRGGNGRDTIAKILQQQLEIACDHCLVLDNQNRFSGHE